MRLRVNIGDNAARFPGWTVDEQGNRRGGAIEINAAKGAKPRCIGATPMGCARWMYLASHGLALSTSINTKWNTHAHFSTARLCISPSGRIYRSRMCFIYSRKASVVLFRRELHWRLGVDR